MNSPSSVGQPIFRPITPEAIQEIKESSMHLESLFNFQQNTPKNMKITLTDHILAISVKTETGTAYVSYVELNFDLKFQRIASLGVEGKNPQILGFRLTIGKQNTLSFYLQFAELAKVWIKWLSHQLNELNFHSMFKPIRKLGKGSSATVYQIERICDGKKYAAKGFSKEYLNGKEERKTSLINELSMLRSLSHQHILAIEGVFESQNSIYVIMEKLNGGHLFDKIQKNPKGLIIGEVKVIMREIMLGLQSMHSNGIMHRDLKLENIILRNQNSSEAVIADLGLATYADAEDYIYYRCGTPGYLAPEIATMKDNKNVSVKCDIFSAGVIFHVLLTQRYLFRGNGHQEIYKNNCKLDFNLDAKLYASLDPEAMDLLRKMLVIDPQERISAKQVLKHQFLAGKQMIDEKEEVSPASTNDCEERNYHF